MKFPKFTKYFYEILAIFIGITLSFMVDEWRENKKERSNTKKALEFIVEDLKSDTTELNFIIRYVNHFSENYKYIFKNEITHRDSLRYFYTFGVYVHNYKIKTTGFNNFENLPNPVLFNKKIYSSITEYYSDQYINRYFDWVYDLRMRISEETQTEYPSYMESFIYTHEKTDINEFAVDGTLGRQVLNDSSKIIQMGVTNYFDELQKLVNSEKFKKRLAQKRRAEGYLRTWVNKANIKADTLIKLIDEELKN